MQWRNDRQRWGLVSQVLHWLVAALVIGLWGLGYYMAEILPDSALEQKFRLYQLHKSFGLTLFALVLLRLGWRLSQPHPQLPDRLSGPERFLAHLTHWGLYAILLAMPLAGWISTEASPLDIPTEYFGLFVLPDPVPVEEALHETFAEIHEYLAFALAGLLALHVAAALKHHLLDRDDVLRRMLPGSRK